MTVNSFVSCACPLFLRTLPHPGGAIFQCMLVSGILILSLQTPDAEARINHKASSFDHPPSVFDSGIPSSFVVSGSFLELRLSLSFQRFRFRLQRIREENVLVPHLFFPHFFFTHCGASPSRLRYSPFSTGSRLVVSPCDY